jgi:hypothetical protein
MAANENHAQRVSEPDRIPSYIKKPIERFESQMTMNPITKPLRKSCRASVLNIQVMSDVQTCILKVRTAAIVTSSEIRELRRPVAAWPHHHRSWEFRANASISNSDFDTHDELWVVTRVDQGSWYKTVEHMREFNDVLSLSTFPSKVQHGT